MAICRYHLSCQLSNVFTTPRTLSLSHFIVASGMRSPHCIQITVEGSDYYIPPSPLQHHGNEIIE